MRLSQPDHQSTDSNAGDLRGSIDSSLAKKNQSQENEDSANQRLQIHASFDSGQRRSTVLVENKDDFSSPQETLSSARLPSHHHSNVFQRLEMTENKSPKRISNSNPPKNQDNRLHSPQRLKHTEGVHRDRKEHLPNRSFNRGRRNEGTINDRVERGRFEKSRGRGRGREGFHYPSRENNRHQRHDDGRSGRQENSKFNVQQKYVNSQEAHHVIDLKKGVDEKSNQEATLSTKVDIEVKQQKNNSVNDKTKTVESDAVNQAIHGINEKDRSSSNTIQWKPTPMPKLLRMAQDNSLVSSNTEKVDALTREQPKPTSPKPDMSTKIEEKAKLNSEDVSSKVVQPKPVSIEKEDDEGSHSEDSEVSDGKSSEEEDSSSEEEEEKSRRKKSSNKNKRLKKNRRKRRNSSSESESSEEDESSDESDRERKKRTKHKKKKSSKKKHSKKKKKKRKSAKGEKHVLSSKDLAALQEKIREDVLKEIKEKLPVTVTTTTTEPPKDPTLVSNNNNKDSDSDSLELDYSSEEPYDENGFHTGLPKKNSPELSKKDEDDKATSSIKENVLDILDEAVEDLDYDLQKEEEDDEKESTEEENWKRQKRDDTEENSQTKTDQLQRERDDRRAARRRHIDNHRRPNDGRPLIDRRRGDIDGRQKRNDEDRRRGSEARRRSNDERKRRQNERLSNATEERKKSEKASSRSKSREDIHHVNKNNNKSEQQSTRSIHESTTSPRVKRLSPKEQDERKEQQSCNSRRDEKPSSNNNRHSQSTTSKDQVLTNNSKRARNSTSPGVVEQLELRTSFKEVNNTTMTATTTTPSDGIAMAKEIRNNVYKTDNFWREPTNEKSFNPRNNVLERRNEDDENKEESKSHKRYVVLFYLYFFFFLFFQFSTNQWIVNSHNSNKFKYHGNNF